jgi:hypothetical protein
MRSSHPRFALWLTSLLSTNSGMMIEVFYGARRIIGYSGCIDSRHRISYPSDLDELAYFVLFIKKTFNKNLFCKIRAGTQQLVGRVEQGETRQIPLSCAALNPIC